MTRTNTDAVLTVRGIPDDVPETVAATTRSRLYRAYADIRHHTRSTEPHLVVGPAQPFEATTATSGQNEGPSNVTPLRGRTPREDESTTEERAQRYRAQQPQFDFGQLVLPVGVADQLMTAVEAIRLRSLLYDDWGLRAIEPSPSTALNLHGPPGTGKTLAAHAIAARLGMPILLAGYAELESKFHGDGPKNIKAAFHAAAQQNAVLFVDEADSLLSRRLTDISQGSEQAINSMRSQIILCLDQFDGVVIFSTNLVANYDKAFESRVRHFQFPLPDHAARQAIWKTLLVPTLPLAPNVDCEELTKLTDGFSGRSIKLVIIAAAERAALAGATLVQMADLGIAIEQAKAAQESLKTAGGRPATPEERSMIELQLQSLPPTGT